MSVISLVTTNYRESFLSFHACICTFEGSAVASIIGLCIHRADRKARTKQKPKESIAVRVMGGMCATRYFVVVAVLLLCDTAKGQVQFTIIESNETVIIGNISESGSGTEKL